MKAPSKEMASNRLKEREGRSPRPDLAFKALCPSRFLKYLNTWNAPTLSIGLQLPSLKTQLECRYAICARRVTTVPKFDLSMYGWSRLQSVRGRLRRRSRRRDADNDDEEDGESKPRRGVCLSSRRDSLIVAWHEVPGKASTERTVPEGRYDGA
jgi:hypothetical protein